MRRKDKYFSAIGLWLATVMLLSACGGTISSGGSASDSESLSDTGSVPSQSSIGEEYTLPRGDDEKQLTIYYNRAAGYDDCDVWLWYDGADGRGYTFYECGYGAKMVVNVPYETETVGFIIRTGCSQPGGTTWGTATKDGTDSDRSVTLREDETVIYTKAGDAKSYTSTDGGKTLKELKYIALADLQDETHIKYVLSGAHTVSELSEVEIRDGDGGGVEIKSVSSLGKNVSNGVIETEGLELSKGYTLTITGLDPAAVVPNTYFSSAAFKDKYLYDGELGVFFEGGSTAFKLWAPTASAVVLNLFDGGNGGTAYKNVPLSVGDKGVWSYTAPENLSGKYYTYTVTTSAGTQEAVDPYAKSAGLNGNRGMIIDLDSTDPDGWTNLPFDNPAVENYTDAVIWEVQVRDFSNALSSSRYKGKFLAFTETGLKNASGLPVGVDYLKELGVTHVHLMPSYDFATVDEGAGGYNWGYDPKNYNVPEGSYSTDPSHGEVRVREFKQMVQALHENGISVVMDVVYNHTYDLNSNLNKIVPYYYYRYQANGTPSNGSGCGNETASDREMFRKYMIDSLLYWMEEYNVDGFRFDLMGLHDTETMSMIEKAVHEINPEAILYGEGWTGGSTTLTAGSTLANIQTVNKDCRTNGVAMFNDVLRDAIKGSVFDAADTGFATGAKGSLSSKIRFGVNGSVNNTAFSGMSNGWYAYNPTNVINYASAHDNLSLWDKICTAYGEGEDTLEQRLKRNALSAAIVYTSLGVPFMQAGEELLRSKKNADGTYNENSYNASDEVNNLRWDFTTSSPQYKTMQYYKGLIALRRSSAALRSPVSSDRGQNVCTLDSQTGGTLIAFTVKDVYSDETLFVVYNAGETDVSVDLPSGSWNVYAEGETASATAIRSGVSGRVTVAAVSCSVFSVR